jgi:hypothetical protein
VHTRADRRRVWMELDAAAENRARQEGPSPDHGFRLPQLLTDRRLPWHSAGRRHT